MASVIENVEVLKQLFATLDARARRSSTCPMPRAGTTRPRSAPSRTSRTKARRDDFFQFIRQLQRLYEVLSPDAFLRPLSSNDYLALVELYALMRNAFSDRLYIDPDVAAKTRALLREHSTTTQLTLPGAIYELGPAQLAALKASDVADDVKVLNLRKVLAATVARDGLSQPFLLSIGERAEALALAYEDRQLTTPPGARRLRAARRAVSPGGRRTAAAGTRTPTPSPSTRRSSRSRRQPQAAELTSNRRRRWTHSSANTRTTNGTSSEKAELRAELYKALRPLVGAAKMVEAANSLCCGSSAYEPRTHVRTRRKGRR